jgi:hypothetical protein
VAKDINSFLESALVLTYYCPQCWSEVAANERICPQCGYPLDEFHRQTFEDKLLAALHHILPERRIMAAQILGNLQSVRALPEFIKIIDGNEEDYFFLRAILLAAVKIPHPDRIKILHRASQHPSRLVSDLAKELLVDLNEGRENPQRWDRHTG